MGIKAIRPVKAYQKFLTFAFLFGVCSILLCISASGLDRNRTITQFQHTAWKAKEGAPSQIRALAQTVDGYLWLGTLNGLYRFDGVLFERYVPRTVDNFPSKNIISLLAMPDGGLWIGYLG